MSNRFNTDTYMRRDFDNILKQYGHDVYLQRVDESKNNTEEDISYLDKLEIHTVRFTITANRTLPGVRRELIEGILNTSERVYYFRYNADPFENDRIYEIQPRPNEKQSVWVIDAAVPLYGVGGNLVFWTCGATSIRPN